MESTAPDDECDREGTLHVSCADVARGTLCWKSWSDWPDAPALGVMEWPGECSPQSPAVRNLTD